MHVHSIDHLELYVTDADQAAAELCAGYGFVVAGRTGAAGGPAGVRSTLLRQRDIALVVTSAARPAHPAAHYVARHGDGVAVLGLAVDDADQAFTEAVRRGAAPVSQPLRLHDEAGEVTFASVRGFGDVEHRFVSRRGDAPFMPGVIEEIPVPSDQGLLRSIDHLAVCLPAGTLDDTVRRYAEVFDFAETFQERIVVGAQAMDSKVVQSASRGVTLTIIEPDTRLMPGQIDMFLRDHGGAGVQHVAFLTEDIATSVTQCGAGGVRFLSTPAAYYDALTDRLGNIGMPIESLRGLNVLADRDPGGLMLQIFAESRHPRRTLFYELIERRGARTFGSNNIKALYEAVERQQESERVPGR